MPFPAAKISSLSIVLIFALSFNLSAQEKDSKKGEANKVTLLKPITSKSSTKNASSKKRSELWSDLRSQTMALKQQSRVLKTLIKLVRPSIAHIEAQKTASSTTGSKKVQETGAGVVFQRGMKHYILTNRHVVKDSENYRIKVVFEDGTFLNPIRTLTDRDSDIAVLEIDGSGYEICEFGNSDDVEAGDFVFAFGSPFGLKHSVSYGIVSAKGRRNLELGDEGVKYQNFFQTDAAINPGNSGGPLVNLDGQVIGINTAIASNSGGNDGVGFSIPVKMALNIADQLITNGRVRRAFLGVQLESKFDVEKAKRLGLSKLRGAKVNLVNVGTPAHKAGLKAGDVVLSFNGNEVEDDSDLVNQVSWTKAGKAIPITIWRARQMMRLETVLIEK